MNSFTFHCYREGAISNVSVFGWPYILFVYPQCIHCTCEGGSVQRGDRHRQPLHWHDPITQEGGRALVE